MELLKQKIHDELMCLARCELTPSKTECIYKLVDIYKDICEIEEMQESKMQK